MKSFKAILFLASFTSCLASPFDSAIARSPASYGRVEMEDPTVLAAIQPLAADASWVMVQFNGANCGGGIASQTMGSGNSGCVEAANGNLISFIFSGDGATLVNWQGQFCTELELGSFTGNTGCLSVLGGVNPAVSFLIDA